MQPFSNYINKDRLAVRLLSPLKDPARTGLSQF
jgi:hypothetical protein